MWPRRSESRKNGAFIPTARGFTLAAVTDRRATPAATELRRFRVKFAGSCVLCGALLREGAEALYHPRTKTIRCVTCPAGPTKFAAGHFDVGTPGASALGEYMRRKDRRETETKERWGNRLGGLVLAIFRPPQATRAWGDGARGEEKVAAAVGVPGVITLSDRRVPGTRGNIDHLVVSPAGLFIVDAKNYHGIIRIRRGRGSFGDEERLYIGRRDCSHLADNMTWQIRAVQSVLTSVGAPYPVTPVLCFLSVRWPLKSPDWFRGVRLEGPKSLRRLVTGTPTIDPGVIVRLAGTLATALPPKQQGIDAFRPQISRR